MPPMRRFLPLLFTLSATPLSAQPVTIDNAFWKQWGDGQAELTGYELRFPRYGEVRSGVAVAILVTETLSESARVQADPGKHPAADGVPGLKHNWVQDVQNGL